MLKPTRTFRLKRPPSKRWRFNKEQREGIAKFLDNIAAALIIGVSVGSYATDKISSADKIFFCILATCLACFSLAIRGIKEDINAK